ncbi:MAG: DNA cytosine methyltransferase [Candidatus Thalassarchaeaceae archaeon]
MSKFTVLELFAGAGGMALGFERAGLESVALVEIDKDACATLRKNRPGWNVLHQDVSEVDFSKFDVDVVSGGFPCQAFSYAGKGLGFEDTRGTLFFEFARAIKESKPKIFIGENVEGLKSHDDGRTLRTMVRVLTDLGYDLQMKVLNATDYSVAQKRKRVFLIGTLPGYHFVYPTPHEKKIVLRDALKDVPPSKGTKFSQKRYDVLKLVPPGGCWVDLPLDIQKEFMGASFHSGGGKRGMARRISWDEACLTLTTSPSQKQTERCHPEETRPFTIREYARIQAFPDEWFFEGSITSSYKQIGNAVAVNVAEAVGKQVIESLTNPIEDGKSISTPFTLKPEPKQIGLFGDVEQKLMQAIQNSELHELKEEITEKIISDKLKDPVNLNSPSSILFDTEDEFLQDKAKGWVKTASGLYLAKLVAAISNQPGWEFHGGKKGRMSSVQNQSLGKRILIKTQGSTTNHSGKIGDKVKQIQMDGDGLEVDSLDFFEDVSLNRIKQHFGLVREDVEEIKIFFHQQCKEAKEAYILRMKEHPDFEVVVEKIRPHFKDDNRR